MLIIPQASILRQIVAGPRQQHQEAGLDLCYVTNNLIATSGPSATYPQRAYRNPLDELVSFLDTKHGKNWCIWEFRAEGTGYPDSEVYNRIHHYPWPDHHPPPFALIPNIMGSMRNWLHRLDGSTSSTETEKGERVAVVHCKAGKGRSGTIACAYLISQEGWKKEDALQRFTERRMRVGFGNGVSIPSQMRYIGYIDRWANQMGKEYVERPVEILEIHVWGLRDGVKVAVEGYVDEGKKIKCFHLFHRDERTVVAEGGSSSEEQGSTKGSDTDTSKSKSSSRIKKTLTGNTLPSTKTWSPMASGSDISATTTSQSHSVSAMIFKPHKPIIVPSSDVNIDLERRSKASYTGFAMVTSVAHIWFNPYFEGGAEHDSGVFETEWEAMDGIKGSMRKGVRALDRLKVVWRYPAPETVEGSATGEAKGKKSTDSAPAEGRPISQPKPGDPIQESDPADWRGMPDKDQENQPVIEAVTRDSTDASIPDMTKELGHTLEKEIGLRKKTAESTDVSLAGSDNEKIVTDKEGRRVKTKKANTGGLEGVKANYGDGDEQRKED
ncbi:Phosphatase tensin type [Penicillium bovifimosum]|uniref:phosphatidylinositol-3,4,5-trisphosphate 3-phosphatase n=1 Tax=Penicillium bovifimosum TaxID=126998 RepID=A0A9W9GLV6_9EURO|nr:Phosphatase tensin type [Penicillium bovifimosum]KAJ5123913.1 Phosphatase tensin type [Penicillium bovifimosum]